MDPSVKKILNNGGFVAILARLLAAMGNSALHQAAARLAIAAGAYREMLAVIGVSVKVEEDWEGCEEAQALAQWINDPDAHEMDGELERRATEVDGWTAATWSAIDDLAHGKVPKLT